MTLNSGTKLEADEIPSPRGMAVRRKNWIFCRIDKARQRRAE